MGVEEREEELQPFIIEEGSLTSVLTYREEELLHLETSEEEHAMITLEEGAAMISDWEGAAIVTKEEIVTIYIGNE